MAATAIANPDPMMIAAVGERPPRPGQHQETWDQAVAATAIYEHRYASGDRTMNGTPPQPTVEAGDQTRDYRQVIDAMSQAKQAALATVPLGDLLVERGDHNSGNHDRIERRLDINMRQAKHQRDRATSELNVERNSIGGGRRGPSDTDRSLISRAEARLDIAESRLDTAVSELTDFRSHDKPVGVRAQLVEDAVSRRIDNAVDRPARYVIDALGPRPNTTDPAAAWDSSARRIETARHNVGLSPADGPQIGAKPVERALGLGVKAWMSLGDAIVDLDVSRPDRSHQGIER